MHQTGRVLEHGKKGRWRGFWADLSSPFNLQRFDSTKVGVRLRKLSGFLFWTGSATERKYSGAVLGKGHLCPHDALDPGEAQGTAALPPDLRRAPEPHGQRTCAACQTAHGPGNPPAPPPASPVEVARRWGSRPPR